MSMPDLSLALLVLLFLVSSTLVLPKSALAAGGVKPPHGQILKYELPAASCQLGNRNLRQCTQRYNIVVNGLDLGRRCNGTSRPSLAPLQLSRLRMIMPDDSKRLSAWRRFGSCSSMSANNYFRKIIILHNSITLPSRLHRPNNTNISKRALLNEFARRNPQLTSGSIDLICAKNNRGQDLLTHVDICMNNGRFVTCPRTVNNCPSRFVIAGFR